MGEEEQIVVKGTIGILEEIANIDLSILSIRERMFMEMYMRCGFEREITLTELCYIIFEDYSAIPAYKKSGRRGQLYRNAQKLIAKRVLEELKHPVRFKLRKNGNTIRYIKWILENRYGIYVRKELIY